MVRQASRLGVLISIAVLLYALPVHACSCGTGPACAAFWDAGAVFVGRADVTIPEARAQDVRFRVDEWFRGPQAEVVEVISREFGGSCDYTFEQGGTYLVYARPAPEGKWKVSICSRTARVEQSHDDLALAREIVRGAVRTGRIHGSAHAAERGPRGRLTAVSVLAGARVTVTGSDGTFAADTNLRGRFEIDEVPPGRYSVSVHLPPNFDPLPPEPLVVPGPAACVAHSITAVRKPGVSPSPSPLQPDRL